MEHHDSIPDRAVCQKGQTISLISGFIEGNVEYLLNEILKETYVYFRPYNEVHLFQVFSGKLYLNFQILKLFVSF